MSRDAITIRELSKGLDDSQRAAVAAQLATMPKATIPKPKMNKTEAAYANHLEQRRIVGDIQRWDFEPVNLRLADNTYYRPDFRVVTNDGTLEYHDTKGTQSKKNGGGYYTRDKGKLKIKVAAEQHPYVFAIVWRDEDGWQYEWFNKQEN